MAYQEAGWMNHPFWTCEIQWALLNVTSSEIGAWLINGKPTYHILVTETATKALPKINRTVFEHSWNGETDHFTWPSHHWKANLYLTTCPLTLFDGWYSARSQTFDHDFLIFTPSIWQHTPRMHDLVKSQNRICDVPGSKIIRKKDIFVVDKENKWSAILEIF